MPSELSEPTQSILFTTRVDDKQVEVRRHVLQEPPFAQGACPSAGVPEVGSLALALLRLCPLVVRRCRSAHQLSRIFLFVYLETNKGKFTNWCELPLPTLDRSVLAHSRVR